MARTRPFNDLTTGQPASGIQRLYYAMPLDDRIVMLERLLAEGHGPRVRQLRRQLRTMQPGDSCYAQWTHYVAVMPAALRRWRRELARLLRLRAIREAEQQQARQHRARAQRPR